MPRDAGKPVGLTRSLLVRIDRLQQSKHGLEDKLQVCGRVENQNQVMKSQLVDLDQQVELMQSKLRRLTTSKTKADAELQSKREFGLKLEQSILLKDQLNQKIVDHYNRAKNENEQLTQRVHELETAASLHQKEKRDLRAQIRKLQQPRDDWRDGSTFSRTVQKTSFIFSPQISFFEEKLNFGATSEVGTEDAGKIELAKPSTPSQQRVAHSSTKQCDQVVYRGGLPEEVVSSDSIAHFDTQKDHLALLRNSRVRRAIRKAQKSRPTKAVFYSQMCQRLDAGAKRHRVALVITRKRLYLFEPEEFSLLTSLDFHRASHISLSRTNFAILSFHGSRPQFGEVVIQSLDRVAIVAFIAKALSQSQATHPMFRRVANVQICPQIGRILDRESMLQSANLMWARAEHRHRVERLSRGFFFDSWEPGFLLIHREMLVFHHQKLWTSNPLVVPLYALSVQDRKRSKDPAKVLSKEHVFSVVLEDAQDIFYFACTSDAQKREVVATLGQFVASNCFGSGKETRILDQL